MEAHDGGFCTPPCRMTAPRRGPARRGPLGWAGGTGGGAVRLWLGT